MQYYPRGEPNGESASVLHENPLFPRAAASRRQPGAGFVKAMGAALEAATQHRAAKEGQLGRIDEARAAVAAMLRIVPDQTLEKVKREIADFNPDAHPDFIEREIDGLRKAGLPE